MKIRPAKPRDIVKGKTVWTRNSIGDLIQGVILDVLDQSCMHSAYVAIGGLKSGLAHTFVKCEGGYIHIFEVVISKIHDLENSCERVEHNETIERREPCHRIAWDEAYQEARGMVENEPEEVYAWLISVKHIHCVELP